MILDFTIPAHVALALLPELLLTVWALVLLLLVGWRHHSVTDLRLAAWIAGLALASAGAAAGWLWWNRAAVQGIATMVAVDDYRFVADGVLLAAAGVTVLVSQGYLERERLLVPEYYLLLLFAVIGMMLMAGAADLIVLFLGLETMSVAVYVMAAIDRRSPRSAEAGLKYFLLGAFASGFLLYGIALLYGATGTTNLSLIGAQVRLLELAHNPMLLAGLGLLLVGFGFKVAAVPFHTWAPDVYDGAPTPVTGFMATAVKAAGFAALFRVLVEALAGVPVSANVLAVLAVATMVVGNVIALAQRALKRMLAWSSVAHAGYLLVAAAAGGADGTAAFLVYIVAYAATTLAAFGIVAWLGRGGESDLRIDDLTGLATRNPWTAFGLAACMLSLLGFPGTVGFIGKWYVLLSAVEAQRWLLAVVLVATSVVSAGFYLPVLMVAYMKPAPAGTARTALALGGLARATVVVAVGAILLLGIRPNRLLQLARETAGVLRPPAAFAGRSEEVGGGQGRIVEVRTQPPPTSSNLPDLLGEEAMHLPATIFRQYDIRGTVGDQVTDDVARAIGQGFTTLWSGQAWGAHPGIAVGRDNRPSGRALAAAVAEGIRRAGGTAIDIGEVPTPALYLAEHTLGVDGAIQITGSHNPPEFNGFKLVARHEAVYGEDLQRLYRHIAAGPLPEHPGGAVRTDRTVLSRYRDAILERNAPLARRVKVVVDCGNGVTSLIAVDTLAAAGADVVPLFADSDGTFPNHHPDPTVPENLRDLQAEVARTGAELGIAFDGDGDRIGAVDERGTPLFGDQLLVLFGRDLAARRGPGYTVIFDVKCSEVLPRMLGQAGLQPVMWKTGHSLIKQKMKETGAPLAGEMSGHMFFGGDYYGFDDALFAAARLLRYVASEGGPLSRLLADLPATITTPELRVDCPDETKFDVVRRAAAHFAERYPVVTLDGVRITFPEGWGLLRASNTQPVLVLRFEASSTAALEAYRAEVEGWLARNAAAP